MPAQQIASRVTPGKFRLPRAAATVTAAILVIGAFAGGAQARSMHAKGDYVQGVPVITSADPTTNRVSAVGFATYSGDWEGYCDEVIEATYDPATGDFAGTSDQVFHGSASDGTSGTLRVFEHFFIDGETHYLHAEGRILSGTGDWTGSKGTYTADGFIGAGPGTWSAHWIRPGNGRSNHKRSSFEQGQR